MGSKTIRTLGDAMHAGYLVHVRCFDCGREGDFRADELYRFYNGSRALEVLRFVCSRSSGGCGSRDVRVQVRADWDASDQGNIRTRPRPLGDGRR